MSRLRTSLVGMGMAVSLAVPPAVAQQAPDRDKKDGERQIEESVRESIENIMRAIEGLIDSVPIYEMPEIQKNGDILIRRKKRTPEPKPEPDEKTSPNGDSSST